jgi:N-ethylmaleimide reductase
VARRQDFASIASAGWRIADCAFARKTSRQCLYRNLGKSGVSDAARNPSRGDSFLGGGVSRGGRNALAAGFDGVELHGANGYLIDQFLRNGTNKRTDAYGGPFENRARFLLEILDAVGEVFGADRVGIRLSPLGRFNDMSDSDPLGLFGYVLRSLAQKSVAYVHLIEARADEDSPDETVVLDSGAAPTAALFRAFYPGTLVGAGGFTPESAEEAVAAGTVDAVAFGKLFISNPDLPTRLRLRTTLNRYDHDTFYGGGRKGYTDYPALETVRANNGEAAHVEACG